MKNTSNLLLTLVSYLITLATVVFLLLAVMPPSLKAQTSSEMVATNTAATNVAAATAVNSQNAPAPSVNIDDTGIHIGDAGSRDNKVPFVATISATLALLIPIIAIVMGCSIPIVIVGLALYFRHRKNKMLHETVRTMVEKGVPIPPEMFKGAGNDSMAEGRAIRPRNDLRTGLILTCLGVGIVLFIGKPGWIILFLGVAFLLIASFDKKNKNDNQPPQA